MSGVFQSSQMQARLQTQVQAAQEKILCWLKDGITPRQLAFTLALGFAIGCFPLLGLTTVLCAVLALVLRLNMPAIQAANWIAMPLQLILLYPFLRLGEWMLPGHAVAMDRAELLSRITTAPWNIPSSSLAEMGSMFGLAMLAWLVVVGPALLLLTLVLTPLMTNAMAQASRLLAAQSE